ncbi:hypothetical protein [Sphingomonas glacialis]|uniref:hypothetical protein n=1 Tax=Sphingomonas glacialis TaxID=658225 RepID=UPI001678B5A8|nr:hypothetical protein [Sphingomonas glacialis]
MQVDLYQTLKSIKVTDDQAKLVVASIEEYIDDMVGDATKPLSTRRSTACNGRSIRT